MSRAGASALGYTVLGLGVLSLAGIRLLTGGWYGTYEPFGLNVLERWPVAWETLYYADHLPTFLGDGAPLGIAAVQYRTFLNLYLGALFYGWSGSAYWSLAAVDLLLWFLAGVAAFHVMRRLGATALGAAAGTTLLVASPILISNMWRHDLHVANFASAAIGLWAAVYVVDEVRGTRALIAALGVLLLILSLTYQYQWTALPVAAVLLRTRAGHSVTRSAVVSSGALVVLLGGTAVIRAAFGVVGLSPTGPELTAVQQPDQLVGAQVAGLQGVGDLVRLLPGIRHVWLTAQAYHPVVLLAGVAGLLTLRSHVWLAGAVAGVLSLLAITLYAAPWTAMSAYPFVYLGAGRLCALSGETMRRVFHLDATRSGFLLSLCVTALATLALASLTNGDLWGDYRFALAWWRLYFGQRFF